MTGETRPTIPRTSVALFAAAGLAAAGWVAVSASSASAWAMAPLLLALTLAATALVPLSSRWGLIALALVGAGCGIYLFGQKACWWGATACTIGEVFDCGKVNASEASQLAGLPIALLGAAFYAGVITAAFSARAPGDLRITGQLTALLSLPALAYSAYLGWVSSELGAFCIVCITMYAINALLFWAGRQAAGERSLGQGLGEVISSSPTSNALMIGALVLLGGWRSYDPACSAEEVSVPSRDVASASDYSSLYSSPLGPISLTGEEPVLGPPTAPVVVVEYADYGCPHCAAAAKEVHELVKLRPDVQVRFRAFPLSGICNPALPDNGAGQERCDAAIAAECARQQGKFWEMNDQLFTNQGFFSAEQIAFMAQDIGLDVPAWQTCLADPATKASVAATGATGGELKLQGTPTFFVKGLIGDRWLLIRGGVGAIARLLEARDDGVILPPPAP